MMAFEENEDGKSVKTKWSRWTDDHDEEDEEDNGTDSGRIVNDFSRPSSRGPLISPVTSIYTPSPSPPISLSSEPIAEIIRLVEDPPPSPPMDPPDQDIPVAGCNRPSSSGSEVFCDESEIPDLHGDASSMEASSRPEPSPSPDIEIIAVTKPKLRSAIKLPDLRETLNKTSRKPLPRDKPPRNFPGTGDHVPGGEIVPHHPLRDGRVNSSSHHHGHGGHHGNRFAPYNGPNGPGRFVNNRDNMQKERGSPITPLLKLPYNGPGRYAERDTHCYPKEKLHINDVCRFWLRGNCLKRYCRFPHRLPSPPRTPRNPHNDSPPSRPPALPLPTPPPGSCNRGNKIRDEDDQGLRLRRDRGRMSPEWWDEGGQDREQITHKWRDEGGQDRGREWRDEGGQDRGREWRDEGGQDRGKEWRDEGGQDRGREWRDEGGQDRGREWRDEGGLNRGRKMPEWRGEEGPNRGRKKPEWRGEGEPNRGRMIPDGRDEDRREPRDRGRLTDERNVVMRSPPPLPPPSQGDKERDNWGPPDRARPPPTHGKGERGNWGPPDRARHERPSDLETRRQKEEEMYNSCMSELLQQNSKLHDTIRHLEGQHHELELNTIDHQHNVNRRLELLADFQRGVMLRLWRNEPALRRALEESASLAGLTGVFPQLGIVGKPGGGPLEAHFVAGEPQMVEARLARQLLVQNRLGIGTEEQLLLRHHGLTIDYEHGMLDRYWRYA